MMTRINSRARSVVLVAAAVVVVALVAYFFRNQFARNWDQVRLAHFTVRYPLLAASLACILVSYLISTAMWQYGVNRLASGPAFSFTASIGMVNATQLTKYIPGRVWGYAMQMALVDRKSLPASAVLYVNLLFTLSKSFISLILGGAYLCLSSGLFPRAVAATALGAVLVVYVFFLLYNSRFFNLLLRVTERLFRRTIVPFDMEFSAILRIQFLGILATAAFGLSAVLAGLGIGLLTVPSTGWTIFAGFPFADTVGFLVFFIPGGLGIREGLFYFLLGEHGEGPLALVLPIVMRLVSMSVEALLGVVGLIFLRRLVKGGTP
jgi:uncharacterized membrane protein YbhN (UPF0104 family)